MKWYFASRFRHREKLIGVANFLEAHEHSVLSKWIYADSLKPYAENLSGVQSLAKDSLEGVLDVDIFVLISDPEGTDMFVELGIALAKKAQSQNIKIYIVGEHSKRSLMQLHPDINHVKDLEDLFIKEKVDYSGFELPVLI